VGAFEDAQALRSLRATGRRCEDRLWGARCPLPLMPHRRHQPTSQLGAVSAFTPVRLRACCMHICSSDSRHALVFYTGCTYVKTPIFASAIAFTLAAIKIHLSYPARRLWSIRQSSTTTCETTSTTKRSVPFLCTLSTHLTMLIGQHLCWLPSHFTFWRKTQARPRFDWNRCRGVSPRVLAAPERG
jgi:hypothetical protein